MKKYVDKQTKTFALQVTSKGKTFLRRKNQKSLDLSLSQSGLQLTYRFM